MNDSALLGYAIERSSSAETVEEEEDAMISSEVEIQRLELPRQLKKESSKMKVNFFNFAKSCSIN